MPIVTEQRLRILKLIKQRGTLTIDAVVDELGGSKTAVRAHLLTLEQAGFLERVPTSTTSAGRPPVVFRVSPAGRELFPSRDGDLLSDLIALLERTGHGGLIETFFREAWAKRRRAFDERLGDCASAGLDERLAALNDVLEDGDFMPAITVQPHGTGRRIEIRECNCPLRGAVRATQIPCRFESNFLAYAVGGPVAEADISPEARGRCVFQVDIPE